jgi:hypothetical protein
MPTTEPLTGWRIPTLPDAADGPSAFQQLAHDAAVTAVGTNVSTYTPGWGSLGSIQPVSPAFKTGRFRVLQGWCDVYIAVGFSASTGGGSGFLYLTLPVAPVGGSAFPMQPLHAAIWIPAVGYYYGFGRCDAGSAIMYPYFPANSGSAIIQPWFSTDASANAGTGSPNVPGSYPIKDGGHIVVSGRYLVS